MTDLRKISSLAIGEQCPIEYMAIPAVSVTQMLNLCRSSWTGYITGQLPGGTPWWSNGALVIYDEERQVIPSIMDWIDKQDGNTAVKALIERKINDGLPDFVTPDWVTEHWDEMSLMEPYSIGRQAGCHTVRFKLMNRIVGQPYKAISEANLRYWKFLWTQCKKWAVKPSVRMFHPTEISKVGGFNGAVYFTDEHDRSLFASLMTMREVLKHEGAT